jgi:hypothetical protein
MSTCGNFIFVIVVQLTSHHFVLKVHPPICGITAHATMPGWLELSIISFCFMILIHMNSELKIGRVGEGVEHKSIGYEHYTLITRTLLIVW